jgi:hypothetical protein
MIRSSLLIFIVSFFFVMLIHADVSTIRQDSSENIKHSFLICGGTTAIIDESSKVIWSTKDRSRDGYVLDNGNILYSTGRIAKEVTRENKVIWTYTLSEENKKAKGELGTVQRLENGNTLVVERGPKPQLLEITTKGEVAVRVPLKPETNNNHMQTRMARKLPNGNYIVPHLLAFAIKEYRPNGEIVRTIKTDLPELGGRKSRNWPFTAILLPNGNFLANLTNGNKTVEFSPEGKVVWKVTNDDLGGNYFKDPCGGQRLPNGNTVIASYGCKGEGVKVFEVTPDKKVVWSFYNPKVKVHGLQVLSTNGQPLENTLMK